MAKYKDPKLFNPQMLLAFFAQDAPEFPKKDGGLRSRLSYLLMPFEFVDVCTRPHHRPMDIDVKLNTVSLIPELLMWAMLLAPGLQAKRSRVITPRPAKVTEDTAAQYMASAGQPVTRDKKEVAIEFADTFLCEWTAVMGTPATRLEINELFMKQPSYMGMSSREVLSTVLCDHAAGSKSGAPFKQRVHGAKDVAVYKAGLVNGLLGRPGFEVQPLKTVTIKVMAQQAPC